MPPTEYQQRCVMFVCAELEGAIVPIGTAFLIGVFVTGGGDFDHHHVTYLVTAKHVIEHGQPTYVRMRRVDGGPPEDFPLGEWVPHPTADVAMTPCDIAREKFIASYERLGVVNQPPYGGQYVPTVGQRAHFVGLLADVPTMAKRAVPMMRSAMIGALYADDIPVRRVDGGVHWEPQAHLIDTYSRSGFSGSPVYVDYSYLQDKVETLPGGRTVNLPQYVHASALLGVLTGHFGLGDKNTGVAIVVPMEALRELLEDPRLVEFREREAVRMEQRRKDQEAETAAVLDSLNAQRQRPPAPSEADERVSLDGIDPEDALRALLRTPPHGQTQDPA